MCDVLTWVKQEDQFSPSLVLWHDGEPVTPKVAIYQGDAGYTVSGTGHTQTFKRLHKAMRYGEAYIIDKEAFDNYGNDFDEDVKLPVDCEVHLEPTPPWTPMPWSSIGDVLNDFPASEETEPLDEETEMARIVRIHIEVSDEPIIEPVEVSGDEYARIEPEDETRIQCSPEQGELLKFASEQTNDGLQVIDPEDGQDDRYGEGFDDGYADALDDTDAQLALECDKALHAQDKKANILIGFSIGLGSAAIASLLGALLYFVSWA